MEIENVINKIRKLCTRTIDRGCTEAEALSSAAMVGELLKVYNLSLDKVFLEQQRCIQGIVLLNRMNRAPVDRCVPAIATMCDCKVWFDKWSETSKYIFFGLETDVEMAKYLYANIQQAFFTELKVFKYTEMYMESDIHRKKLTTSFQRGMAGRVSQRLREMTNQRHSEEEKSVSIPFLVVENSNTPTRNSILHIKRNKIDMEFEKLGMHLRSHNSQSRISHFSAYHNRIAAGGRINLNRPISQQSNVAGYLQ